MCGGVREGSCGIFNKRGLFAFVLAAAAEVAVDKVLSRLAAANANNSFARAPLSFNSPRRPRATGGALYLNKWPSDQCPFLPYYTRITSRPLPLSLRAEPFSFPCSSSLLYPHESSLAAAAASPPLVCPSLIRYTN
jgi:hypothetical protein